MTQDEIILAQQARIEQLKSSVQWALGNINCEPFEWACEEDSDAHRHAIEALAGYVEVFAFALDADEGLAHVGAGDASCSASHEWVGYGRRVFLPLKCTTPLSQSAFVKDAQAWKGTFQAMRF